MALLEIDAIALKNVSKKFGSILAVNGVSLTLKAGQKCCLIGPTGSGKTTILRLIAGLEQPDEGEVLLKERRVSSSTDLMVPPHERKVSMLFQNLALWPHVSVLKHTILAMDSRLNARERDKRGCEILKSVGLESFENCYPSMLSGGQCQKLAIARAMSAAAEVALLDEPFAHLDPEGKFEIKKLVQEWIEKNKITLILVTHDPLEDLSYFDRVATLSRGRLAFIGKPEDGKRFLSRLKLENLDGIKP